MGGRGRKEVIKSAKALALEEGASILQRKRTSGHEKGEGSLRSSAIVRGGFAKRKSSITRAAEDRRKKAGWRRRTGSSKDLSCKFGKKVATRTLS